MPNLDLGLPPMPELDVPIPGLPRVDLPTVPAFALPALLPSFSTRAIMTKFKILVGMLQLTTNFGRILAIEWPFTVNLTMEWLSFVNLDFLRIFPTGCVVPSSHFAGLTFMTVTPLFLSGCLLGVYFVASLTVCLDGCLRRCCGKRADPNAPDSFAVWAKKNAVPTELALLFFVFPGITTKTFRTFICERFDNGDGDISDNPSYLSADLSVECDGSDYDAMVGYALASAMVFCIGIPLVFSCLLWRARKDINPGTGGAIGDLLAREKSAQEKPVRVGSVSFLYADYKPSAWWYELFVMARKLFMSGVLVFMYEGTATQIVVAELVALGSLAVLTEVEPYLNPSDATLAKFAQWSEILVLLGALLVKMSYLMTASTDEGLFSAVLVVALLVPIVLAVGAAVRDVRVALRPLRPPQRRRAPRGPVRVVAQEGRDAN